jgi:hypothetical protein
LTLSPEKRFILAYLICKVLVPSGHELPITNYPVSLVSQIWGPHQVSVLS